MKIIYFLKKFYRPFILTYLFFSIGISFYPSFEFYSLKGQLLILAVSISGSSRNGILLKVKTPNKTKTKLITVAITGLLIESSVKNIIEIC